jgi:hypothetical protein
MLTKKYTNLGFQLTRWDGLYVLEFRIRIIFILGDDLHIRNGFIRQLCDTYLNSLLPSPRVAVPA